MLLLSGKAQAKRRRWEVIITLISSPLINCFAAENDQDANSKEQLSITSLCKATQVHFPLVVQKHLPVHAYTSWHSPLASLLTCGRQHFYLSRAVYWIFPSENTVSGKNLSLLWESLSDNETHFTLGTTSERGRSLCSNACFLAAGSSSTGAEGDEHLWELRFWQAVGGTGAWASALLFPRSPAAGRGSLKLFSWRPPHNIKRDEDGKHRKGWLGTRVGFPFSVLEAAGVEGCEAWLLIPFGNEKLGTSAWTIGKTAWGKGLTQKSESPGTGRREKGKLMLEFFAELSIVSVSQALFLKNNKKNPNSNEKRKNIYSKIKPLFCPLKQRETYLDINVEKFNPQTTIFAQFTRRVTFYHFQKHRSRVLKFLMDQ